MNKKIVFWVILIIFASITKSYSQPGCFLDTCEGNSESMPPITYQVNQVGCGTCTYTVNYSVCYQDGVSFFLINSIAADITNPPCCFGTAQNDPIISGYILEEAARLISLTGTGSPNNRYSIYTPSRCWRWEGLLGPYPIHDAVFVPCGDGISCCRFDYEVIEGESDLIGITPINEEECSGDGCFQIC